MNVDNHCSVLFVLVNLILGGWIVNHDIHNVISNNSITGVPHDNIISGTKIRSGVITVMVGLDGDFSGRLGCNGRSGSLQAYEYISQESGSRFHKPG